MEDEEFLLSEGVLVLRVKREILRGRSLRNSRVGRIDAPRLRVIRAYNDP